MVIGDDRSEAEAADQDGQQARQLDEPTVEEGVLAPCVKVGERGPGLRCRPLGAMLTSAASRCVKKSVVTRAAPSIPPMTRLSVIRLIRPLKLIRSVGTLNAQSARNVPFSPGTVQTA